MSNDIMLKRCLRELREGMRSNIQEVYFYCETAQSLVLHWCNTLISFCQLGFTIPSPLISFLCITHSYREFKQTWLEVTVLFFFCIYEMCKKNVLFPLSVFIIWMLCGECE